MSYTYEEPKVITKSEFMDIVRTGDVSQICDAVVRAVHFIHDYDWLLQQYTLLLKHADVEVRGATVTCIGHLARMNEIADKNQLLEALKPLLLEEELSGRIDDAIDDINTFL
ncbi:MAG: hypothetical protein P8103_08360 [Candidatus Thiodiazotropha sp.]